MVPEFPDRFNHSEANLMSPAVFVGIFICPMPSSLSCSSLKAFGIRSIHEVLCPSPGEDPGHFVFRTTPDVL